jgi:hypothetical protein
MKMELDVEALEKQLRDCKETPYKLFEGKRRAEEQVAALESHQLNSISVEDSSQKQKDQLHDMAQMVNSPGR